MKCYETAKSVTRREVVSQSIIEWVSHSVIERVSQWGIDLVMQCLNKLGNYSVNQWRTNEFIEKLRSLKPIVLLPLGSLDEMGDW